jgi:NAD(P)-dependent dehydrogenase (short-subunit alcohol dehydrogenase family)
MVDSKMASYTFSSVFITGSNRGLGLNMIKHILNSSTVPKHIIATCRSLKAENAQELQKLAETNSNIHVLEFDMTDVSGPRLPELVKQVSDIVQESGLNLLINNAGMNLKETFDEVSPDIMRRTFDVNTIAPCMITKAFRPLLKRAAEMKQPGEQPEAAVVNISSNLGSIDNITNAYQLAYKVSKAALNMVTKAVSGEFADDGITVVSVHPGWVKTDMGGSGAPLTVDESISSVMKVISSLQKSQTGSFFSYDGTILPW